ncbi:CpsD/CapB family tyrosine-protein kinase [Anaerocolumna xylanovorans]|uniref:non-specific protein-tyrosine kinase n=1 Tax=Anaerocolumna xylanovorans DSM 12503 TaxID=1121345 RepID=A0A1M7YAC1_9FIRM|nr:CpsD/CapB family tyrosine-protein kinase [Anaerocolumna xylanovorans]SHO49557.1 capsular exopolysaccharide family [Anaerocolumna xylanovorans DSM 12503]
MQSVNIELTASLDFRSYEAYNTLRTNIQFCGRDTQIICVTSCTPGEGKSTVALRLAASLAETGKKILFIDADLRKSVLVKRLKVNQSITGLSQYLSGMSKPEEVIYATNTAGLDIIFSGPMPPNPSDLLSNKYFRALLEDQRKVYDYIIIDTPPLGLVIDSANVAENCDGAVIVIQADANSYKFVQKIIKQLEKSNCRVLGAVLNKVDEKHQKRYYGRRYKQYYGSAYASADV